MNEKELTIAEKIKFVQDTLYTVSGKWRLPILMAMYEGASRFRDLQRAVSKITTRILSRELKELESHYLITKCDTTYTLTDYAFSLKPLVDEMIKWGQQHRKAVTTGIKAAASAR